MNTAPTTTQSAGTAGTAGTTIKGGKKLKVLESIEKIGIVRRVHENYLRHVNESKFVIGIAMILLNIGSKYVDFKFSKTQEQMLRNNIAREILIFAIVFMGTRDIRYAILLTAAFIILSEYVFNEKSKYCCFPKHMKKIKTVVDVKNDDYVSQEEEQKALDTLKRAERNREKNMQHKFSSYLTNMNNTMTSMFQSF
jgi:hypothetical protein